ncbi:COA8 family protein Y39B6A.34, mitochondrial-like [Saccoglossus kowalevskii]|uniref:APOPT family protein Y39B6A.34, mitochondrial-like n=1 Tax=Saccoglossus kowalevskii TaxID=10224 RepID=A0ABM0GIU2_SACKO|nr:PREDICTED: APOPT family protein Y39B6A.34, mitochondrial-like [Saccoglossus kowalevskii]
MKDGSDKSRNKEHKLRDGTTSKCHFHRSAPSQVQNNWIGPPDKLSNIRTVKYGIPENESKVKKEYRLMREETDKFNHLFWTEHNAAFIKAKEIFIESKLDGSGDKLVDEDGTKHVLTAEEMAEFYRDFLNCRHQELKDYNREWYKRNLQMLWPAIKANIHSWFAKK